MAFGTFIIDDLFTTAGAPRNAFPVGPVAGVDSAATGAPTNFNAPSVGDSWIDHPGGMFELVSSGLAGWGASTVTTQIADVWYRPAAENFVNGRLTVHFPSATTVPTLVQRFTTASGGSAYIFEYTGSNIYFYRCNNGVLTNLIFGKPVPSIPAAAYFLDFDAINLDATHCEITAQLYLEADYPARVNPYWIGPNSMVYMDTSPLPTGAQGISAQASTTSRINRFTSLPWDTGALAAGTLWFDRILPTSVRIWSTPAGGGTPPYTFDVYQSTTNGVKGSLKASSVSLPYTLTGLSANTAYWITLTVNDAAPDAADSAQLGFTSARSKVVYVGDSNMANVGNNNEEQTSMPALVSLYDGADNGYNLGYVNQGVTGSMSWDWISGSANLIAAKAAAGSLGASDYVVICLGTNDSKATAHAGAPTTQVAYQANLLSQINDWKAAFPSLGGIVLLNPFWPGPTAAGFNAASPGFIQLYGSACANLVDNVKVFQGDTEMYEVVRDYSQKLLNTDNLHLNTSGQKSWAGRVVKNWPFWPDGTVRREGGSGGSFGYCG